MKKSYSFYMTVVFLVILAVGCLQVSGTLKGKVVDDGGSPVQGAIVTVSPYNYAAVTDSDGNYKIEYLPLGTYSITATSGSLAGMTNASLSDSSTSCAPAETVADITLH